MDDGDDGITTMMAGQEEYEWSEDEGEDVIVPMPGQDHVSVSAGGVGTGERGFQDGAAAAALFRQVSALLPLADGRVLVADQDDHRIRMLSADLQQVSTVAGDGEEGHRDGAATQAQLGGPGDLALLRDGRVLVADTENSCVRMLSADLQQVSTMAGDGEEGYRDGAAAQAQFISPSGLASLPDGRVLVVDSGNNRIRMLSADLLQVSTVAGDGDAGHRDGAAAQAQFNYAHGIALLPDGRVLVADSGNNRIRMLSADLQQVSTVVGDGGERHRDGIAVQAQIDYPTDLALLPDGRMLVATLGSRIRVLSADLLQVSTLTNVYELANNPALGLLPDGRLLHDGSRHCIRVFEGFPPALLSTKPSHKPPKKTKQKKKRSLAGGASSANDSSSGAKSPGPVPKRNCSVASRSSSAAMAASSSDSDSEEQPGGSAAEAEPLV
jgi:hypothetical protein